MEAEASAEVVQEGVDLVEDGKFNVLFSKVLTNPELGLFKYDSIKELSNYINDRDADIGKVKALIKKANRSLIVQGKQLYVRKAPIYDKEAKNRICMTTR